MVISTESLIKALPLDSETVMLNELNLIKNALEKLFEANEAQLSQEELSNNLLKILEISRGIQQAETVAESFDIYYLKYRPLLKQIKAKYSIFSTNIFIKVELYEKYLDGLKELINIQNTLLLAFEDADELHQYEILCKGMARLADLVEEYSCYFSRRLLERIKDLALIFLNHPNLTPDKMTQAETVFPRLVELRNAAKAILWQIDQNWINLQPNSTDLLKLNSDLARELQIWKNQAAIEWSKLRLEQIERTRQTKG